MPKPVEHRLAVADQGFAGAALETSVAEERDQGGDEQVVERTKRAHAAHRGFRDLGVVILEERNQQVPTPRVADLTDGGSDISADERRALACIARQGRQHVFGRLDV